MFNEENPVEQMVLDTLSSLLAQGIPHNAPSLRKRSAP